VRVLLTGFSSQQCGGSPIMKYVTVSSMIRDALRDEGHEVDNRKYQWDDDPTAYDAVLIGLVPPLSINGRLVYSGLKAIHDCLDRRVPMLFFVDDPNYYQSKSQYPTVMRVPERLYRQSVYQYRPDYARAIEDKDKITRVVTWMSENLWPTVLLPAYEWGDHDAMPKMTTVRQVYADPSAYVPDYKFMLPVQKERVWIIGGIVNPLEWLGKLNLTWPYEMYGNAKYNTHGKLFEENLVRRFASARGVLCQPRVRTRATGWWRSRYLFAAKTGCILLGEDRDLAPLGDSYTRVTPAEVEQMDDIGLDQLAAEQGKIILDQLWTRERYSLAVDTALQIACNEVDRFHW
jgi:hypothetical protein